MADGGIRPPRIVTELVKPSQTVIYVKDNCPASTEFELSAVVRSEGKPPGFDEKIEARWFLDYSYSEQRQAVEFQETKNPGEEELVAGVPLTPWRFRPLVQANNSVHVVELVISNGFQDSDSPALRNRTAAPGFETQVFRWIFQIVPAVDTRGVCELK